MRNVTIEWRHLDVQGETCERCGDTGHELVQVIDALNRECASAGVRFGMHETLLGKDMIGESNAVFIDGRPLESLLPGAAAGRSDCRSCGTLIGDGSTACRTLDYGAERYEAIPGATIREAVCRMLDCCHSG